jgi:hypothetical protein
MYFFYRFLSSIFILYTLTSCVSETVVEIHDQDEVELSSDLNDLKIETTVEQNITDTSFQIELSFSQDENTNASALVYFCNETDLPGCNPISGTSLAMTKTGNTFSVNVNSLTSPNDPGDTFNYLVVPSDADGIEGTITQAQLTLQTGPPTKIYRSVGPSNTAAVDDHNTGADTIAIVGDQVTFSSPIVDIVGVGDVLVYDGGTKFAFIHGRTSSTVYTLKKTNGITDPDIQTINNDWEIFRAYTSLADADEGVENTGVPVGIRDFDTWVSGRDLVDNNEQWNIALYDDDVDSTESTINTAWVTSKDKFLKIFSPKKIIEVGISQRHDGSYGNGYKRTQRIIVYSRYTWIEGISKQSDRKGIEFGNITTGTGEIWLTDNLMILNGSSSNGYAPFVFQNVNVNYTFYIWNNIVFQNNEADSSAAIKLINNTGPTFYIYNNTIVSKGDDPGIGGSATNIYLKNNIIKTDGAYCIHSNIDTSEYNTTSDGTSDDFGGSGNKVNQSFNFNSLETYDFRLGGNSYGAIGAGADLSADPNLPITTDIMGNTRTRWDVGASTAATAIFRSVGPGNTASLKGTSDRELSIVVNSDGHTQLTLMNGTTDLPLNVGVGDVIQYDPDNAGGVDSLAFISERIDQNNYIVKQADGSNANISTVSSTSWDIFRAYTAIENIDSTTENTGVADTLEDFDTSSRLDLVTENSQMKIALYADGALGNWSLTGWSSNSQNRLKLFSPNKITEVGVSQRHTGVWDDSKARIVTSNYFAGIHLLGAESNTMFLNIDGIQINTTENAGGYGSGIEFLTNGLLSVQSGKP